MSGSEILVSAPTLRFKKMHDAKSSCNDFRDMQVHAQYLHGICTVFGLHGKKINNTEQGAPRVPAGGAELLALL